jgi:hypothetical protein
MGKVSYTALVLDEPSRTKLLQYSEIPDGWENIAHHMTLNMGEIKPEYEKYLGMTANLKVIKIGMSDLVMAAMVETTVPTANDIPHITIAVNRQEGGKPFMSNKITNWKPIQFAIELTGTVKEVGYS